jgi:hypothetical protein
MGFGASGFLAMRQSIGRERGTFNPAETESPREPRPRKTAPRLRDGSLMLFTPTLVRTPVHPSRLVGKFEARPVAAQPRLDLSRRHQTATALRLQFGLIAQVTASPASPILTAKIENSRPANTFWAKEPRPTPSELRPRPSDIDRLFDRLTLTDPIAQRDATYDTEVSVALPHEHADTEGVIAAPLDYEVISGDGQQAFPLPLADVDRFIPLASGAAHEHAPHFYSIGFYRRRPPSRYTCRLSMVAEEARAHDGLCGLCLGARIQPELPVAVADSDPPCRQARYLRRAPLTDHRAQRGLADAENCSRFLNRPDDIDAAAGTAFLPAESG